MKNQLFIIITLITFKTIGQTQPSVKYPEKKKWRLELLFTQDILNTSYGDNFGFVFKVKRPAFQKKHFDLYYGVCYQNSYIDETDNLFTKGIDGYTKDNGLYVVYELRYQPFQKKKFYVSLEPFIGLTHLKSKGTLRIPEHDVYQKYKNNYTYFNYGLSQSIGININDFSISGFAWGSLKGFLDNGRSRPADFDSRLFLGIGLGYSL